MCLLWAKKLAIVLFLYTPLVLSNQQPSFFDQSFYFNWDEGEPVPIPVTRQCDTLHIKWSRDRAEGPNPMAPYTLQIYTSTFVVPFTVDAGSNLNFDWQVPFVPGTQYQVCMFDKNGNSGGCEAVYTVIDPASSPASCTNITFPGVLEVEGIVRDGPLSQYGWVDSCTDIQVKPKGGTPPYTFTAAPALHPPWNITMNTMDAINWTVALSWASPFFISLVDSAGNAWSHGPLHSGGLGHTSCLDIDKTPKSARVVPSTVMVGSVVAALALGLIIGALIFWLFSRRNSKSSVRYTGVAKNMSPTEANFKMNRLSSPPREASYNSAVTYDSGTSLLHRLATNEYAVEPFMLPAPTGSDTAPQPNQGGGNPTSPANTTIPLSPTTTREHLPQSALLQPTASGHNQESTSPSSDRPPQSVYVVHHDAGGAPVTVYTADGTEVVELPPRYAGYDRNRQRPRADRNERRFYTTNGTADAEAEGSMSPADQARRPGPVSKP